MSYILNALRKSEQERQDSYVDTLENRIQDKQQPVTKKTSIGLIALVVFNLVFVLYFAWSFTKDEGLVDKSEMITVEKPVIIKAKPALKVEKELLAAIPAIDEQPTEYQQLSIAEQINNQKIKRKTVADNKPEIEQNPQTVAEEINASKPPKTSPKQERIVARVMIDKPQDGIPFLSTLDYDFRRKVPDLNVNVYVYAEKQQDRFIMIAMKKYLSGQQIVSGMTLKEIRMNSLVIEYKNREFQIKRK